MDSVSYLLRWMKSENFEPCYQSIMVNLNPMSNSKSRINYRSSILGINIILKFITLMRSVDAVEMIGISLVLLVVFTVFNLLDDIDESLVSSIT